MSEQEFRVEKCGGLTVYHPIKKQAEVIEYADWFNKEWEAVRQRSTQRREQWDAHYFAHLEKQRAA